MQGRFVVGCVSGSKPFADNDINTVEENTSDHRKSGVCFLPVIPGKDVSAQACIR